jgi:hypothetical protein
MLSVVGGGRVAIAARALRVPSPSDIARRLRAASRPLILGAASIAVAGILSIASIARAGHARTWPGGVVRYYDATDMHRTVAIAVARWNASGADVHLVPVASERAAQLVVRVDDPRLLAVCGADCLGFSSAIGRPAHGRSEILLAGPLSTTARPLSVWVAAHELGHVLGLHHRRGRECSLMSAHAFDTRCPPSLNAADATPAELACVPAPADVDVAVGLYGGAPARRIARCR